MVILKKRKIASDFLFQNEEKIDAKQDFLYNEKK